jgi:hypothetical protein
MSRGILRPVLAGLALASVLILSVPALGEAAGPRERKVGSSFVDFLPRWVGGLLEKIGWQVDPNGTNGGTAPSPPRPDSDIGMHIDPDG